LPTYEYLCKSCGHGFEASEKITDPPLKACPKCKKGKVERLLNASAFILKGKGWYVTDYARKDGSVGASWKTKEKEEKSTASGTAGPEKKETKESKETKETKDLKGIKEAPKDSSQESLQKASNS